MTEQGLHGGSVRRWINDKLFLGMSPREYAASLMTPIDIAIAAIIFVGLVLIGLRFAFGLDVVTGASQEQPWGLLLGVGLFAAVPLSATGYVLGSAVYLFGVRDFRPVVKNAILIGFLGYFFAVVFLLIDLGRPWRIYYPMFVSYGTASVMFLVAWHVALYLSVQFLEFSPDLFKWLGLNRPQRLATSMTVGLTIFGVILSTLHQSALGGMYLLAPGKVHPLWYTTFLPWLYFVSSIAAGLSMVILVSAVNKRFFPTRADPQYLASLDHVTMRLGRGAAYVLLTYFGFKLNTVAHENTWAYLNTSYGYWFLFESLGLVLFPCFLFAAGTRRNSVPLVRLAALLTIIGIIANRLTVSLIAFNWHLPHRELFNWKEFLIVISVITMEVVVYRWIVNRMPILSVEEGGAEPALEPQTEPATT
jgi:Ni/Fe-hydrogenase subunit HybB-like protein